MTMDICDILCDEDDGNDIPDEIFSQCDELQNLSARMKFDANHNQRLSIISNKNIHGSLSKIVSHQKRMFKRKEQLKLYHTLRTIWSDPTFQKMAETISSPLVQKNMTYDTGRMAIKLLEKLFDYTFRLTHDDLIHIRMPTDTVTNLVGTYNDEKFLLVDVGGQVHLQEEWGYILDFHREKENCSILFIASLADYKYNEPQGNRLEISLNVWERLLKSETAMHIPIVLVLNKQDLFFEFLKKEPLSTCPLLKNIAGRRDGQSVEGYQTRCVKAIQNLFRKRYMEHPHGEQFQYGELENIYVTDATDQNMVESIVHSVIQNLNKLDIHEMFSEKRQRSSRTSRNEKSVKRKSSLAMGASERRSRGIRKVATT